MVIIISESTGTLLYLIFTLPLGHAESNCIDVTLQTSPGNVDLESVDKAFRTRKGIRTSYLHFASIKWGFNVAFDHVVAYSKFLGPLYVF